MNKKQNYQIITERIDDVVLLLNVMKQIELPELINSYLPRHPNQQGRLLGMGSSNLVVIYPRFARPRIASL